MSTATRQKPRAVKPPKVKLIFDTTNSYLPSSQGVMSFAIARGTMPPCQVAILHRLGFRPLPKPLGPSVISPA